MKKNKAGYYTMSFTHGGKRYFVRARTPKELLKKFVSKQDEVQNGTLHYDGAMTVNSWAWEWLNTYKKDGILFASYMRYASLINRYLVLHIGNMAIQDVQQIHLQKILNMMKCQSTDTIKRVICISRIYSLAQKENGLLKTNPAEYLKYPKTTKLKSHRTLTKMEYEHTLKIAETHPAGLWIKMLLFCGLRPAETRALQWKHIDFVKKRLNVQQSVEKSTENIKSPKSDAGIRSLPIPKHFLNELVIACSDHSPDAFIFTQTSGKPHTETSLRTLWKNFKNDLDISMGAEYTLVGQRQKIQITSSVIEPGLVPYCYRHTYCTELQAAGIPINIARELMGHSDIKLTTRIYTHSSDKALSRAATILDDYYLNV